MMTQTETFVHPKIDFVCFQTCSMFILQFTFDWFKVVLHCIVYCAHLFFFYQSVGHISRCISWSEATAMFVMCTHWTFSPCFNLHFVFLFVVILCVRLVGAFILFFFVRSFSLQSSSLKWSKKSCARNSNSIFEKEKRKFVIINRQQIERIENKKKKQKKKLHIESQVQKCSVLFRNLPTNYY